VQEDFVCAVHVRVEDNHGGICALKADSSYACWVGTFPFPRDPPTFGGDPVRAVELSGVLDWDQVWFLMQDGRLLFGSEEREGRYSDFRRGQGAMCTFSTDGELECSGDLDFGLLEGEVSVDVALGSNEGCALTDLGLARCSHVTLTSLYTELDVNAEGACGITLDGEIECRMVDAARPLLVFPPGPYRDLRMAARFSCALRESGELQCVDDPAFDSAVLTPEGRYVALDAGDDNLCAIHENGSLACVDASQALTLPVAGW
jgi:hypothetical protein